MTIPSYKMDPMSTLNGPLVTLTLTVAHISDRYLSIGLWGLHGVAAGGPQGPKRRLNILYSSFHFLFHYTSITPIYYIVVSIFFSIIPI